MAEKISNREQYLDFNVLAEHSTELIGPRTIESIDGRNFEINFDMIPDPKQENIKIRATCNDIVTESVVTSQWYMLQLIEALSTCIAYPEELNNKIIELVTAISKQLVARNVFLYNQKYNIFGYILSKETIIGLFDDIKLINDSEAEVNNIKKIKIDNPICRIPMSEIEDLSIELILNDKLQRYTLKSVSEEDNLFEIIKKDYIENFDKDLFNVKPLEEFTDNNEYLINRNNILINLNKQNQKTKINEEINDLVGDIPTNINEDKEKIPSSAPKKVIDIDSLF